MGKWVASQVLDGALAVISGADRMLAVAGQPSDYETALANRLAEAGTAVGDFEIGSGSGLGRRISIAPKIGMEVTVSGTADHVALINSVESRLLYVTTCPAQQLAAGSSVSFEGWSVEISAPY